ncbi:MAG: DUF1573 domain-containing protein [Phycisphaerae bacterium]|nr:DUF1573 domain-containing protein [Phycisphaerae bacterium]
MNKRRLAAGMGPVVIMMCLANATAQSPAPDGPPANAAESAPVKLPSLQLVSPRLDFGAHRPLTFISDTMTFVNSGTTPITIEKAQGECSCTDVTILGNQRVLQPGDKIEMLVAVEFPRESGLYTKNIHIFEKGNPVPLPMPFDFEVGYPIVVNGGPRYAIVTELGGKLTLKSRTGTPFRVLSISGMAPIYNDFDPATDPLRDNYTVYYKINEVNTDEVPRWLVVETDHPDAEMIPVPARFQGYKTFIDKSQWHAMDEFIALGTISSRGPTRTTMLFTGKAVQPGKAITVSSSNSDLGIQIVAVRRPDRGGGMQVDFDITPNPQAKGFTSTIATIEYDGVTTRFDVFCRLDPNLPAAPVPNR